MNITEKNIVLPEYDDQTYGEVVINREGISSDEVFVDNKLSSIENRTFCDEIEQQADFVDFSFEMINAIKNNFIEIGYESEADKLFNSYHEKYGTIAFNWLIKLFIDNIFDTDVALGIILTLSRQKIKDIGYQGQLILITASYKFKGNIEIEEAIIRCIENWESHELVNILDQLHPTQDWLCKYKETVIKELKDYVIFYKEN